MENGLCLLGVASRLWPTAALWQSDDLMLAGLGQRPVYGNLRGKLGTSLIDQERPFAKRSTTTLLRHGPV